MSADATPGLRQRAGCWLHERWRTELVLRAPGLARWLGWSWLDLCNRNECLSVDSDSGGRACLWSESSNLTVARIFPEVGARLLQHCFAQWPVRFSESLAPSDHATPQVSFILGVRGRERLSQFEACMASLRAQVGISTEIIVVEQSWRQEFAGIVSSDVRYHHQQATDPAMPFNRSWALNGGARLARGHILVFHDADMLVPARFARCIAEVMQSRLDALRLPRFIFYLDQESSETLQRTRAIPSRPRMERVVANNRTPVAVTRDAYFSLGGHDECFYGWGAEDDEFMARLATLRVGEGAMFPILHLWHPSAASASRERNSALLAQQSSIPVAERISALCRRPHGGSVPSVPWTTQIDSAAGSA